MKTELKNTQQISLCILARKRLYRNTRVVRQAKALTEAGHRVTVVALELPCEELRNLTPEVEYIEVPIISLFTRAMQYRNKFRTLYNWGRSLYRTIFNTCRRLYRLVVNTIRRIFRLSGQLIIRAMNLLSERVLGRPLEMATPKPITPVRTDKPPVAPTGKQDKSKADQPKSVNPLFTILVLPILLIPLAILNFPAMRRAKLLKMGDADLIRLALSPYLNIANSYYFGQQAHDLLDGRSFDYYQAHDTYALPGASLMARKTRGRIIYDCLEIPEERSGPAAKNIPWHVRWLEDRIEKRLINKAAKTLTVGPSVAKYTADYYNIDLPVVVRNCCLFHEIVPNSRIKQDLGLDEKCRLGLVIGAIYNNQGLEQIIEALPHMDENIHMAAMGPVAEHNIVKKLKNMAKERGVRNRFHILDAQPPHTLFEYSSGADLGVIARQASCLNNLYSLPNKIFELIMSRLPVACGNLPDIKKIVEDHQIGGWFDEKDPEDIAKRINSLLSSEKRLCELKQAVKLAARELCWENESRKYVDFIES